MSDIINRRVGVSSDKVARVNEAILSLNDNPDATARILKTNKTNRVAVVLPNIIETNFAQAAIGETQRSLLSEVSD